jgi:Killer toxin-resistance protein 1
MQPLLLSILALLSFTTANPNPQAVAPGGGAAVTLVPTQSPTVGTWGSLITVDGTTSVAYVVFTQTFAVTALGTWDLGPTPAAGTIGLGTIVGNVGSTKAAKRAMPTPGQGALEDG